MAPAAAAVLAHARAAGHASISSLGTLLFLWTWNQFLLVLVPTHVVLLAFQRRFVAALLEDSLKG